MLPKQFWTKILKVILVLFLIGGAIGFLIDAIITRTWWIALVGWIATFFSASGIGTLIEISENTAKRLETENLREGNFAADPNDPYAMFRNGSAGSSSKEAESDDPYSLLGDNSVDSDSACFKQSMQKAPSTPQKPVAYEKNDSWVCPACGEFNNLDDFVCKRCDNQVWVCPICGEANNFDNKTCSKCGWQA